MTGVTLAHAYLSQRVCNTSVCKEGSCLSIKGLQRYQAGITWGNVPYLFAEIFFKATVAEQHTFIKLSVERQNVLQGNLMC